MKNRSVLFPVLALASLLAVPLAQEAGKKPVEPAKGQARDAGMMSEGQALKIPVSGLSKENEAKVKESLTALASESYACPSCKHQQAMAGKCTACKVDLKLEKHPLFTSVQPSLENKTVQVTLDAAQTVRYSELERALVKDEVKLDASAFPIPGQAKLVLRGGSADGVATVEKALKDAKLFDDIRASFDATKGEMTVTVRAGAMAPTRGKVSSALEAAGVKASIADVILGQKKA